MEHKNITQLQLAVIKQAYDKFCTSGIPVFIDLNELTELANQTGTAQEEIESQIRQLVDYGLLEYGATLNYDVTWSCLHTYERNNLGDKVQTNNKIRRLIIDKAYEARNNQNGGFVNSDVVYADDRAKEFTQDAIYSNVWYLEKAGHIKASLMSGMGFRCRLVNYDLVTNS
jgi:hypothetical protein